MSALRSVPPPPLADGRVLIAGVTAGAFRLLASAEAFDPGTNSSPPRGSARWPRRASSPRGARRRAGAGCRRWRE
jgi:hypothetical protein